MYTTFVEYTALAFCTKRYVKLDMEFVLDAVDVLRLGMRKPHFDASHGFDPEPNRPSKSPALERFE